MPFLLFVRCKLTAFSLSRILQYSSVAKNADPDTLLNSPTNNPDIPKALANAGAFSY